MNEAVVIDDEFRALIPPLAEDELARLESAIIAEGCLQPLVVWRQENILVDGHNRYDICQRNHKDYSVVYRDFDCREAVTVWMIEHQLGRRNLPEAIRIHFILRLKDAVAAEAKQRQIAAGGRGAEGGRGNKKDETLPPNSAEGFNGETRDKLAAQAGVGKSKFTQAEAVLTKGPDYLRDLYKAGAISANLGYDLYKLYAEAPASVQTLTARTQETNTEKLKILIRLNKNSADTFTEIAATGFIQPGDESDAVNWLTCTAIEAQKALDKKADYRRKEAIILRQAEKRAEMAAAGQDIDLPETMQLYAGDFRDVLATIPDNSIDLIFTDPPYDRETIPLYGDLACHAARILKPGGSLIAYAGHYALPDILSRMGEYLRYWWMLAIQHTGGNSTMYHQGVYVKWKPLVWYVKQDRADKEFIHDLVTSQLEGGKDLHDWQQGISEARYYINALTAPNAVVLDPFMGSGTTLAAALELGRRAIGIDLSTENVAIARGRLHVHST